MNQINYRKEVEANVIKGFFDKNFFPNKKIDTFVHSHVFEHIYDIHEFMNDLGQKVNFKDKLIFSILIRDYVKKYTNCINFEHTIFLTKLTLVFLKKYGFKIIEKKYFKKIIVFSIHVLN